MSNLHNLANENLDNQTNTIILLQKLIYFTEISLIVYVYHWNRTLWHILYQIYSLQDDSENIDGDVIFDVAHNFYNNNIFL